MGRRLTTGSQELKRSVNEESDVEKITADGALSLTKGVSRVAGTGALNALTLAAPTLGMVGFKKTIRNTVAFQCTVTITGIDPAANNVWVLPSVAGNTTVMPSITLRVENVDGTAMWALIGQTGAPTVS